MYMLHQWTCGYKGAGRGVLHRDGTGKKGKCHSLYRTTLLLLPSIGVTDIPGLVIIVIYLSVDRIARGGYKIRTIENQMMRNRYSDGEWDDSRRTATTVRPVTLDYRVEQVKDASVIERGRKFTGFEYLFANDFFNTVCTFLGV